MGAPLIALETAVLVPLITPEAIRRKFSLSSRQRREVLEYRSVAKRLMLGEDNRLVVFAGPCSIHDPHIALEYGRKLKKLSEKISDQIFLLMRAFLEKPRTQFGWTGFLRDPSLDGSYEIERGLIASRELLLQLTSLGVPIVTEFLDPILSVYIRDVVTWGIIGARTSSSQIHRQLASQLSMPVGFKNDVSGILDHAICGALSARRPQLFLSIDKKGRVCPLKTSGNPLTHIILRGGLNGPNYDRVSVSKAIRGQYLHGLTSRFLVDCSHGNSQSDPQKQRDVFASVLEQIQGGNRLIMGMMMESHIEGGNAISLTDPCLNWEETEEILLKSHRSLKNTSLPILTQGSNCASTSSSRGCCIS